VEILFCYPLDGVVLTTGCDKTPAWPNGGGDRQFTAIVCPRADVNGWHNGSAAVPEPWSGKRASGLRRRDRLRGVHEYVASSRRRFATATPWAPLDDESLAEAPACRAGRARNPRAYRERGQIAYETGKRIVEMSGDLKPWTF